MPVRHHQWIIMTINQKDASKQLHFFFKEENKHLIALNVITFSIHFIICSKTELKNCEIVKSSAFSA